MRLTDTQQRVLSELAHMRTLPEDAILPTLRLAQLANFKSRSVLLRLEQRGLIERIDPHVALPLVDTRWRTTDQGRAAL